jgi:hypothetical protein
MSWWKSKATVKAKETARQDDKAKPATENKAKDKELIPAEWHAAVSALRAYLFGLWRRRISGHEDRCDMSLHGRRKVNKCVTVSLFLLPIMGSAGYAATLYLACSYHNLLDRFPAANSFSVQIQSSDEHVTSIKMSMGAWCDSRDGQVTSGEISFPCAIELAGQRISFSFTLDRLSGAFEQRSFFAGKLLQVHHGSCTLKSGHLLLPAIL